MTYFSFEKGYLSILYTLVCVICLSYTPVSSSQCGSILKGQTPDTLTRLDKSELSKSTLFSESSTPMEFLAPDGQSKITTRTFLDQGFQIQMLQSHQSVTGFADSGLEPLPFEETEKFIAEIVEALQQQYPRRGWTQEFIEKVGENLRDYLSNSTILIVRNLETGEVEATLRLISSPYLLVQSDNAGFYQISIDGTPIQNSLLPVERYFLEESLVRPQLSPLITSEPNPGLPASLQSIFEISSFTIKKNKQRSIVVGLLFKYFLFSSYLPTFTFSGDAGLKHPGSLFSLLVSNPDKSFVHAYGDRTGRIMYTPYDFRSNKDYPQKELMGQPWELLSAKDGIFSGFRKKFNLGEAIKDSANLYYQSPEYSKTLIPIPRQYNPPEDVPHWAYDEISSYMRATDVHGDEIDPEQVQRLKDSRVFDPNWRQNEHLPPPVVAVGPSPIDGRARGDNNDSSHMVRVEAPPPPESENKEDHGAPEVIRDLLFRLILQSAQ